MSSEPPENSRVSWVDWFHDLIIYGGKISTLLMAVITLGAAVIWGPEETFRWITRADPSTQQCFSKGTMSAPEGPILFDQWRDQKITLTGNNECDEDLTVYVTYKGRHHKKLVVKPPYLATDSTSTCLKANPSNRNCWDERTIDKGEVDEKFSLPVLERLSRPLGRVNIEINWTVRNTQGKILVADTADITLEDPPKTQHDAATASR